jgi:hypothetical protein
VVSERNGTWGNATEVPGLAALNGGGDAQVDAVSCTPAGTVVADVRHPDMGAVRGDREARPMLLKDCPLSRLLRQPTRGGPRLL